MGFSRQEYWSGLPYPPPGDLPDPGIKLASPESLALQADSLLLEPPGSRHKDIPPAQSIPSQQDIDDPPCSSAQEALSALRLFYGCSYVYRTGATGMMPNPLLR